MKRAILCALSLGLLFGAGDAVARAKPRPAISAKVKKSKTASQRSAKKKKPTVSRDDPRMQSIFGAGGLTTAMGDAVKTATAPPPPPAPEEAAPASAAR